MMPTWPVQMPFDGRRNQRFARNRGLTFIELVIVTVIVGLFAVTAQLRLSGLLRKHTFKSQVQEFVSALRMAATAASESRRRYEVVVDLAEQGFMLREITSPDLFEVLEEEIIIEKDSRLYLTKKGFIDYYRLQAKQLEKLAGSLKIDLKELNKN